VIGHEVAAVIVTQRQAAGGAGGEVAELLAHGHAQRLCGFEAGAAPESLLIILVGAGLVLPVIGLYTVIIWRVFGGKARELKYD
jgi:hypothetical protein